MTPDERREWLAKGIAKASHTVDTAIPDSPTYKRALDAVARLRAEYLQLEVDAA